MTTYYVAKTGSDSHTCVQAQSEATPKLTINAGVACLSSGDTLIVKSGDYTEVLLNTIPSGTAGAPTTLRSDELHGAVMFTDSIGTANWCTITIANKSYITIDGMTLDGSNSNHVAHVYLNGTNDHIVIQNNEIRYGIAKGDTTDNPMGIADNFHQTFITIRNNTIHHIGTGAVPGSAFYSYGIYFHGNDSVVENNEIYNCAGFGIHNYNAVSATEAASNTIWRNNIIHHNGIPSGEAGVLFASGGTNNTLYNNLIYSNGGNGIQVDGYGVNSQNNTVYNNTIYGNGSTGIVIGSQYQAPTSTTIRNNICYQNGTDTINDSNGSVNTISDHNLLGVNPLFVSVAENDFHLTPGSPAINAGIDVGLSYFEAAPDIGAFEYQSLDAHDAPPLHTPMTGFFQVGIAL